MSSVQLLAWLPPRCLVVQNLQMVGTSTLLGMFIQRRMCSYNSNQGLGFILERLPEKSR